MSRRKIVGFLSVSIFILFVGISILFPDIWDHPGVSAPASILKLALGNFRAKHDGFNPETLLELKPEIEEISRCETRVNSSGENLYLIVIACERRCFKLDIFYHVDASRNLDRFHVNNSEDFVPWYFRQCQ